MARRPKNSAAWKQQKLPSVVNPLPTLRCSFIWFTLLGVVSIALGAVVYITEVPELSIEYSARCAGSNPCTFSYTATEKMEGDFYVYYELTGIYQNHRRYVVSKSADQLSGETDTSLFGSCEPLEKSGDKYLYPCGLTAANTFTDEYSVAINAVAVDVSDDNVAWPSDAVKYVARNATADETTRISESDGSVTILPPNVEDTGFKVWMRQAALPDFRKLYGIIQRDKILKGDVLTFTVENSYDVEGIKDGSKSVVISSTSWLGGANPMLAYQCLIAGITCFLFNAILLLKMKVSPVLVRDERLRSQSVDTRMELL